MNNKINEAINIIRATSSNIITAIDNIGVDITKVIDLENVVKNIHEQSTIIYNYLDNNILSHINVVDTEYEINVDFIMSVRHIYHATKDYGTFIMICDYNKLSPIEMIQEFANDLIENPVLFSEIQTTHDI